MIAASEFIYAESRISEQPFQTAKIGLSNSEYFIGEVHEKCKISQLRKVVRQIVCAEYPFITDADRRTDGHRHPRRPHDKPSRWTVIDILKHGASPSNGGRCVVTSLSAGLSISPSIFQSSLSEIRAYGAELSTSSPFSQYEQT